MMTMRKIIMLFTALVAAGGSAASAIKGTPHLRAVSFLQMDPTPTSPSTPVMSHSKRASTEDATNKRPHPHVKSSSSGAKRTEVKCPYEKSEDDGRTYLKQGTNSYQCHSLSPHSATHGCPEIHRRRMLEAWKFGNAHTEEYVEAARSMDIHPLFDKSDKIAGAENYEMLDKYQIDCLMQDEPEQENLMFQLEDKGELKNYAKKLFGAEGDAHITEVHFTAYCPNAVIDDTDGRCNDASSRDHIRYERAGHRNVRASGAPTRDIERNRDFSTTTYERAGHINGWSCYDLPSIWAYTRCQDVSTSVGSTVSYCQVPMQIHLTILA